MALEKHPNIVRCYYMEDIGNQPFAVLEWIPGHESRGIDLRSWLRFGPLGLGRRWIFTLDICRGLAHVVLKQPGIVHRDVKPDNVLISRGQVGVITDFGLAKTIQDTRLEIPEDL